MNRIALALLVLSVTTATAAQVGGLIKEEFNVAPRFFTDNSTLVTVGVLHFALAVAAAIGLCLLLFVPFLLSGSGGDTGSFTGFGTESSYSSYGRKASFNPYKIDWEKFSILEWISVAEETWRKFDPGNLECQKRLICELHQNTYRLGYVAQKLVDAFSYLEYAEVLKLPEEVKFMIDDYLDAADRGRSMKKDCGEVFSACDFSVKKLIERVTDNEIK